MKPSIGQLFWIMALGLIPQIATPKPIHGVALGHYTDIRPSVLEGKLKEIRSLGASHVSVVVSWSTRDVRSNQIAPRKNYTTPDRVTARIINRAHRNGLKVLLFPILDVQKRKPLEWRGTLKPPDWSVWWRSYRRFILHYARIASMTKAEIFCVGSELVTTEHDRKRWIELIAQVRRSYGGKLLYSANWDHYQPVTFWDKVDLVGLTAYYGLAKSKDAPVAEMVKSWKTIQRKLLRWSARLKRKIVFTEVGYPSLDGGAVSPWDYTQGTAPDAEEQARAYRAFVKVWSGSEALEGVFFWDWYGGGGMKDTTYTPRKKPAAQVIKAWFSNPR